MSLVQKQYMPGASPFNNSVHASIAPFGTHCEMMTEKTMNRTP